MSIVTKKHKKIKRNQAKFYKEEQNIEEYSSEGTNIQ